MSDSGGRPMRPRRERLTVARRTTVGSTIRATLVATICAGLAAACGGGSAARVADPVTAPRAAAPRPVLSPASTIAPTSAASPPPGPTPAVHLETVDRGAAGSWHALARGADRRVWPAHASARGVAVILERTDAGWVMAPSHPTAGFVFAFAPRSGASRVLAHVEAHGTTSRLFLDDTDADKSSPLTDEREHVDELAADADVALDGAGSPLVVFTTQLVSGNASPRVRFARRVNGAMAVDDVAGATGRARVATGPDGRVALVVAGGGGATVYEARGSALPRRVHDIAGFDCAAAYDAHGELTLACLTPARDVFLSERRGDRWTDTGVPLKDAQSVELAIASNGRVVVSALVASRASSGKFRAMLATREPGAGFADADLAGAERTISGRDTALVLDGDGKALVDFFADGQLTMAIEDGGRTTAAPSKAAGDVRRCADAFARPSAAWLTSTPEADSAAAFCASVKADFAADRATLSRGCVDGDAAECTLLAAMTGNPEWFPVDARMTLYATPCSPGRRCWTVTTSEHRRDPNLGVARDDDTARDALDRGCAAGNATACDALGRSKAGDAGGAMAAFRRGCDLGRGVDCRNFVRAALDAKRALPQAETDLLVQRERAACDVADADADACIDLGALVELRIVAAAAAGDPVARYGRACTLGHPVGCAKLILAVVTGGASPTQTDLAHAAGVVDRECARGDAFSCAALSVALHHGLGLARDDARAKAARARACLEPDACSDMPQ